MFPLSPGFKGKFPAIFSFQPDLQKLFPDHMLHVFARIFVSYLCVVNDPVHNPASSRNRDGSRSFSYCILT